MVTRREFLRTGVMTGAGLLASGTLRVPRLYASAIPGDSISKWMLPLPIPGVQRRLSRVRGIDFYEMKITQFQQQVLPPPFGKTVVWGYNGAFPGPTIEARQNRPIYVKWTNQLGAGDHLLPVDSTLHGAHAEATGLTYPARRIVTHLHGGEVPPSADGFPEGWYTQTAKNPDFDFASIGQGTGFPDTYQYPNVQPPATLWYHDHAIGITRLNVYAGLAGFYLLRNDDVEMGLRLPRGRYEIPIAIQDRRFDGDGQLYFPATLQDSLIEFDPVPGAPTPTIIAEFAGDVSVVNGAAWPFLNVEPAVYRIRLLNGSSARFYFLRFATGNATIGYTPVEVPIYQIGTDGGYLPAPVPIPASTLTTGLLIAPGERTDLLVDFRGLAPGTQLVLHNNAEIPFSGGIVDPSIPSEAPLFEIMQVRVVPPGSVGNPEDQGIIPAALPYAAPTFPSTWNEERWFTLNEGEDEYGRILPLLKNQMWADPLVAYNAAAPELSDYFARGSSYRVSLVNETGDYHPIHFHLRQFHLLDRVDPAGGIHAPGANEVGWKDTVQAPPGWTTRILLHFPTNTFSGYYPWHCHILDHEDHEMMLRYFVS